MKLSDEQKHVISRAVKLDQPILTIGGYAGTGKTVVLKHLSDYFPNFAVCAYTGKASDVLRRKGVSGASTIHSLIYELEKDEFGNPVLDPDGCPNFVLKTQIPYDGILLDEGSMVGKIIFSDLCSFGLPIIVVGDHGQLEPIGNDAFNLMKNPDYTLETIHRNAGEIAYFAEHIRKGYKPSSFAFQNPKNIIFLNKYSAEPYYTQADQIICAYNKTRVQINRRCREMLGYFSEQPSEGDRIICLKNDKQKNLFNGMQGTIKKLFKKPKNKMLFAVDDFDHEVLFDPMQFNQEKFDSNGRSKDDPIPFDYSYCITAHKSQGSEYGKVMVIEQRCEAWDHRRWAYTAASRAKEKVFWVS